jgi:RNA polymerase sigma factor (sigma-70 family)
MHQPTGRAGLEELAARGYATERGRLMSIARANTDRPEDAEEALNEAFVLFLTRFDPRRFPEPLSWLTVTLKRLCWGAGRRAHARRERRSSDQGLEARAARGGDRNERVETVALASEVRAAMSQLKPQGRRVVGLLALGYSYREIMELTGSTYTKVNRCSAEGRARLRELGLEIYKCH